MLSPTIAEPDETKIFNMAQEVNQLPKEEYKIAMQMIRAEIIKKSKAKIDFTY